MKISRLLAPVVCLGLMACEQVVLQGPVGDATITITDLRTGAVVGEGTTDGETAVIARVGQADYDAFNDAQKLGNYGLAAYQTPPTLAATTLYLYTVTGGNDYDVNGDKIVDGPTPVQSPVHAIMNGATFNAKAFAVNALSETAYQVVVDHLPFMTDGELQATLDEVARALVGDTDDTGAVDYLDIRRVNYIYADPATQVIASKSDDLIDVAEALLSAGDVQDEALEMFADDDDTALAETVYEASVGPILELQGCASSACHAPGGAGALLSDNVLLPSTDPGYVRANTDNFMTIVECSGQECGIEYIMNKVSGAIQHTGAVQSQIDPDSDEGEALEAWLELL